MKTPRQIEKRQYQIDNLDKLATYARGYRAKRRVREIGKKRRVAFQIRTKNGKSLQREVAHHLERGRDAGRIAVWLNQPVSLIQEIIAQIHEQNPT